MRRRRWLLIAVTVALAAAALARADDVVPIRIATHATVTPNKAGTPRHPRGVKVDVTSTISIPDDYDPPLVQTIDVWFPKGGVYHGGRFPACAQSVIARRGVAGCPKGSIMGHGTAKARADTVFTYPKITVVNGGQSKVYFYTVLQVPARVQAPVIATITPLPGNPRWSYRAHATIPRSLQIVAGIPLRFDRLHVTAGRRDWLATTGCPRDHRWRYHVEVRFDSGQVVKDDGSVGCRP
jgi:hypothetical protein